MAATMNIKYNNVIILLLNRVQKIVCIFVTFPGLVGIIGFLQTQVNNLGNYDPAVTLSI